jgi:predicted DNA-binding transcriptional regulator AlpA
MTTPLLSKRYLKSSAVMKLFGYKNRSSFHAWVKQAAVPHVRLNPRRFVFDEQQLSDWIAKNTVGVNAK